LPSSTASTSDGVHEDVVGEPRHEQARELREGRLVVERGGEDAARLSEEREPLLGVPLLRDVVEDGDDELHVAVRRQQRGRADDRPALLAARHEPVAEHALARLPLEQRAPVRKLFERERLPVLPEDLEALDQLRGLEAQHLLGRLEPAEPRRGVVRVDEASVRALRRDPVPDVAEDRRELVGRRERDRHPSQSTAPDEKLR
jgi:hypothetical protein